MKLYEKRSEHQYGITPEFIVVSLWYDRIVIEDGSGLLLHYSQRLRQMVSPCTLNLVVPGDIQAEALTMCYVNQLSKVSH